MQGLRCWGYIGVNWLSSLLSGCVTKMGLHCCCTYR